jgi:hypothetical protein
MNRTRTVAVGIAVLVALFVLELRGYSRVVAGIGAAVSMLAVVLALYAAVRIWHIRRQPEFSNPIRSLLAALALFALFAALHAVRYTARAGDFRLGIANSWWWRGANLAVIVAVAVILRSALHTRSRPEPTPPRIAP